MERIDLSPVLKEFQQHHRAAHAECGSDDEPLRHRPSQQPSREKRHEDDEDDTGRSAKHRHVPNPEQFLERELDADRKHQEDDADIGKDLEGLRMGHLRPRGKGADQDPTEDVPDDEWLAQKVRDRPAAHGGEEQKA